MLPLINKSEQSYGRSLMSNDDIIEHALSVNSPVAALTDHHSLSGLPDFLLKCEENGLHGIAGLTVQITDQGKPLGELVLLAKGGRGFAALRDILDHVGHVGLDFRYNPERGMSLDTLISGQFQSQFKDCLALDGFPGSIGEALIKKEEGEYSITATKAAMEKENSLLNQFKKQFNDGEYIGVRTPLSECPLAAFMAMPEDALKENDFGLEKEKNIMETTLGYAKDEAQSYQTMQWFKKYAEDVLGSFGDEAKVNRFLKQKYTRSILTLHQGDDPAPMFKTAEFFIKKCTVPLIYKKQPESMLMKGGESDGLTLEQKINQNWEKYKGKVPSQQHSVYEARLKEELSTIQHCNFENYFLNIDKIHKLSMSEGNDAMLRGSAVASLIMHISGISPIDPIKHNLLFARFMSRDRIEEPDVDIEFVNPFKIKRDMESAFEEGQIAALSNDSGLSKPTVLLDLARDTLIDFYALDSKKIPLITREVDKLKNHIKRNSRKKWANNLTDWVSEVWDKMDDKQKNSVNTAVVGIAKNFNKAPLTNSRNAGAIVIVPTGVGRYFNLIPDDIEGGIPQIPQGKYNIIPTGHIKYDLLANKSFTRSMNIWREINLPVDLTIDENDPSIAFVFSKGAFLGVNQVSGNVGADIAHLIKPSNFNELTAVNALIRDGGDPRNKAIIDQYNYYKNNPSEINIDEVMTPILGETNGCLLYEEQMMLILTEIGGFEWSEADRFRSGLKKGKWNVIDDYEKDFIAQASKKYGVDESRASNWYQPLREKRGRFVFNKAHAVAYAHLGVRQTWLKVNYPADYAAELFCDPDVNFRGKKVTLQDYLSDWALLYSGRSGPQDAKDFVVSVGKVLLRESKNPDSKYSRQLEGVKSKIVSAIDDGFFDFALPEKWTKAVLEEFTGKVFSRIEENDYEIVRHRKIGEKPVSSKATSQKPKNSTSNKSNNQVSRNPDGDIALGESDVKPANRRPGLIGWNDKVMIGHLLDFLSKEKVITGLEVSTGKASYADHYRFSVKGPDGKSESFHVGAPSTDPVRAALRTEKKYSLSSGFFQGGVNDRVPTDTLKLAAEIFNIAKMESIPFAPLESKGRKKRIAKEHYGPFMSALSSFVRKSKTPLHDTESGGMLSMTKAPIEPTSPVMTELFSGQIEKGRSKLHDLFEVSRRISVNGMSNQLDNGHVVLAQVRSDKPQNGIRKGYLEIVANYRKVSDTVPIYETPMIKDNVLSEGGHQRFMMDYKKGKTSKIDLGFTTRRVRGHVHGHVTKGSDFLWLAEAAMDAWSFNEMQDEIRLYNEGTNNSLPFAERNCVAIRSAGGATDSFEAMLGVKIIEKEKGVFDVAPVTKTTEIVPFSQQDQASISAWFKTRKVHWLNDNTHKNKQDYNKLIALMKGTGMSDQDIGSCLVVHHADSKKTFNQNVNQVYDKHMRGDNHSFLHQSNFDTWLRGSDMGVKAGNDGELLIGSVSMKTEQGPSLLSLPINEQQNMKRALLEKFQYISGAKGLGLALDNDGAGRTDATAVYKVCSLIGVPTATLMPKERKGVLFTINGKAEPMDLKDHNDYLMAIRKLNDGGEIQQAMELIVSYSSELKISNLSQDLTRDVKPTSPQNNAPKM